MSIQKKHIQEINRDNKLNFSKECLINTAISSTVQKKRKIRTISLFSGCGGLDLGIKGNFYIHKKSINVESNKNWVKLPKNDFEIIFANDIMPQAEAIWKANFKGKYYTKSLVDLLAENFKFPQAELVVGGFPCQDFSVAGKRRGFNSERGVLYRSMVEVVKRVRPKAFIAENVYGLLSIKGAKEKIIQDFEQLGYQVFYFVLSAEDYGIPQTRKRVFFVGFCKKSLKRSIHLDDIKPKKTHEIPVKLFDIFADLEEPDKSEDFEQQHYSKARWYGFGRQGNIEVNLNSAGPTMRAEHHGNIEFRRLATEHGGVYCDELAKGMQERRLSVRECARIQTFPDDFKLMLDEKGSKIVSASYAYKVLGNSVPPLLSYHLAKKLNDLWYDIL